MIRIGIVAAESALRIGLRTILSAEGFDVIGEAVSLEDYQELLPQTDILVITGETTSADELSNILLSYEAVAVLLITAEESDLSLWIHTLDQHVWGILPLDSNPEELRLAAQALFEGLVVISPPLMSSFLSGMSVEPMDIAETGKDGFTSASLTKRESQVLHLLAQGLANKQIAFSLGVSERTVKFHISGIFSKLGVSSRTEAVRIGVRQGMITL
jgi:two-component system, NarL family, response regulator YdfI